MGRKQRPRPYPPIKWVYVRAKVSFLSGTMGWSARFSAKAAGSSQLGGDGIKPVS